MTEPGAGERLLQRALLTGSAGVRLRLRGGCMQPLLREGDWATFCKAPLVLRPGALVLARLEEGELVCHRLLRSTASTVVLCGDAGSRSVAHPMSDVLGIAIRLERGSEILRLDHSVSRRLDTGIAFLHRLSLRYGGSVCGRLLELARRAALRGRCLSWRPASKADFQSSLEPALGGASGETQDRFRLVARNPV